MSALGRIFTVDYSALEFNTTVLSGTIDVAVIEDDSGRRRGDCLMLDLDSYTF